MLLLRRLRLALPLTPRLCACRRLLDPLGDHRAACATSGALASRALPLERAVARVCQEAGARVARNVRLADMNLPVPAASRGPELTVSRASPYCKQRGESVATPTPSYRARRDATSSYSLLRLVAAGVPSLPPS